MSIEIIRDLEQGTDRWLAARRGMLTASVVGKLVTIGSPDANAVDCDTCAARAGEPCLAANRKTPTPIKTFHDARIAAAANLPPTYTVADNDTSRGLLATLAAERIAGRSEDSYLTRDMERGVLHEPYARDEYAKHNGPVEQVGFIIRTEPDWELGYSPDGLVGDDGLLEIKAPRDKTHLLTVLAGEVPDYNMGQCQAGLLVTGRKWIDFMPFADGLPLWTKRVTPEPTWQGALIAAAIRAEQRIAEMVQRYREATAGLPITAPVPDIDDITFQETS